eukprot:1161617-Pelagomonas_calceolata.AAC.5
MAVAKSWLSALVVRLEDLQVLLSKLICAANVHGDKACPKGAFAITLKEDSASNTVALESSGCVVVQNVVVHLERKRWHGPEGTADLFMECVK